MNAIKKGVCAPQGFTAGTAAGGIKKAGTTRSDCAIIVSDRPASVAGMFTTNRVFAAPVGYCRGVCASGHARAIVVNSGNANACTGDQGDADVLETARVVGEAIPCDAKEICVCSTGVIGVPMPMERLTAGLLQCARTLSDEQGEAVARAIMTTDTVPKCVEAEVKLPEGTVRIGGTAKGAGMIAPNLATMLAFLTTDAHIAPANLKTILSNAVNRSFNCICIDNDMSTNDTLLCLANGASNTPELLPGTEPFEQFQERFTEVCIDLACALVRDGEGATKFVEITVQGAKHDADARLIAGTIARSQLCKTAFYGQDANWGRIACAAGYGGAPFDPHKMDVVIQGICVLRQGCPTAYSEEKIQELMKASELKVEVTLEEGSGQAVFWTSDLSTDYVKINADYRT